MMFTSSHAEITLMILDDDNYYFVKGNQSF